METDLGGTELFVPLKWLKDHRSIKELSRCVSINVFIYSNSFLWFGNVIYSQAFIKDRFVFIPFHERVDIYVQEQLKRALQSSIQLPPVYANDRLSIYDLTNTMITLPLDENFSVLSINEIISRLAAKVLILELEHTKEINKGSLQSRFQDQTRKKYIIQVSLKYNILSPYKTLIAVEKLVNGNNDNMILREIPNQTAVDLNMGINIHNYNNNKYLYSSSYPPVTNTPPSANKDAV
ncbi:hypothetical protein I4U23_016525 [Adineta vaga]|nr:hypothetical protein I4U23_016525 [Adineta vaga]